MGEIRTQITKQLFHLVIRDVRAGHTSKWIAEHRDISESSLRSIKKAKTWPGYERNKATKVTRNHERSAKYTEASSLLKKAEAKATRTKASFTKNPADDGLTAKQATINLSKSVNGEFVGREEFDGLYKEVGNLRQRIEKAEAWRIIDSHNNKRIPGPFWFLVVVLLATIAFYITLLLNR